MACRPFLLLTTQRSGSTWLCQVLTAQPGVTCGSGTAQGRALLPGVPNAELLIEFSYMGYRRRLHTVTWEQWERRADSAFSAVARDCANSTVRAAAGYKLMYDQVPRQLSGSGDAPFFDWLRRRGISVVHLERGAKILSIASGSQSARSFVRSSGVAGTNANRTQAGCSVSLARQRSRRARCSRDGSGNSTFGCVGDSITAAVSVARGCRGEFHCNGHAVQCGLSAKGANPEQWCDCVSAVHPSFVLWHTNNASLAHEISSARYSWSNGTLARIRSMEAEDRRWEALLRGAGAPYHRVYYEQLLGPSRREQHLRRLVGFLGAKAATGSLLGRVGGSLVPLHEPSCRSRVLAYRRLRAAIPGTRTAAACDALEKTIGRGDEDSPVDFRPEELPAFRDEKAILPDAVRLTRRRAIRNAIK